MKQLLLLEYLGGLLLGMYLFSGLSYSWWLFFVLLLTPDIGMLGYLFGPRVGAIAYNLLHHLLVVVVVYLAGSLTSQPIIQLAGSILIAHLFLDRAFGYGLKHLDGFKHTHLGTLR